MRRVTPVLLVVILLSVYALAYVVSISYELTLGAEWQVEELGRTAVEDGFYQLAWDSKHELQLAYIGVYGPYYALLYGERVHGEWNLTFVSRLFYEHAGVSLALDSEDNVYICTSSYHEVDWTTLGPHILFAARIDGVWTVEIMNITSHCSSAEVAVDSQDNVHIFYTTIYATNNNSLCNSTLYDVVWTPHGKTSTALMTYYGRYNLIRIDDLNRRPDGSIGMIYARQIGDYQQPSTIRYLNYTIYSDGLTGDSTVIPDLQQYGGRPTLCHDSSGSAYISEYRWRGADYAMCYFTNTGGNWTNEDVAYGGNHWPAGSGIAVDGEGRIYLGYFVNDYDGQASNHTVRYCSNQTGVWETHILDECAGWSMGEYIALLPDNEDYLHIVYFQRTTNPEHGDHDVTVYTTSDPAEDRLASAAQASGPAVIVTEVIAAAALLVVMRLQNRRERRLEDKQDDAKT